MHSIEKRLTVRICEPETVNLILKVYIRKTNKNKINKNI